MSLKLLMVSQALDVQCGKKNSVTVMWKKNSVTVKCKVNVEKK